MHPRAAICAIVILFLFGLVASAGAQSLNPAVASDFIFEDIAPGFVASMAQMAFGPDGRLYLATYRQGILRFDYDAAGNLSQQMTASSLHSLGVAFHVSAVHGTCMYVTPIDNFSGIARIQRLTDDDGDGNWGEAGETNVAIVDNIPVGSHRTNQLQVRGDALYVGIGNRTDAGVDEAAYSGVIAVIEDLDAVPSTSNAAGFGGIDLFTNPAPYLSTDPAKLVIHGSSTRNPFGIGFDGDGRLWMTNNQNDVPPIVQDQLFLAEKFADYGYPKSNQQVDWRTLPAVTGAGWYLPSQLTSSLTVDTPNPFYEPDDPTPGNPPGGLGPNSSADGFDFYAANAFPLRFHRDMFLTRASSSDPGSTGLSETYEDVVAVDLDTGDVVQIVDDLNRPLDVLHDGAGQMLVAEFGRFAASEGRVYRLKATNPVVAAHDFQWDASEDGVWTQREAWNEATAARDRLYPHEWGSMRHAVAISSAGEQRSILLDRDVRVSSLVLGETLRLPAGRSLEVGELLDLQPSAVLSFEANAAGANVARIASSGTTNLGGSIQLEFPASTPSPGTQIDLIQGGVFVGALPSLQTSVPAQLALNGDRLIVEFLAPTHAPLASRTRLLGVQPNPANPRATVSFELAEPSHCSLRLYDSAGRLVRTLENQWKSSGRHRTTWDGADDRGRTVASGVYVVRLESSMGVDSLRLALVR